MADSPLAAADTTLPAVPDSFPHAASDTTGPEPFAIDTTLVSPLNTEGLPIARIDIQPKNIFDPLPEGRLRPILNLVNRLHIRTRASTVREQLLFESGDPWTDRIGHETARNLRSLAFLEPQHIEAKRRGDSVDVQVVTRDVWSTQPQLNIESSGGHLYGSIAFSELNFMGLGKAFSLSYREIPNDRSRGFSYSDPGVLGSRVRMQYAASNGTNSANDFFAIGQPFYSEAAPHSFGLSWSRGSAGYSLYENGSESVRFGRRIDELILFAGSGRRSGPWVQRWTGTFSTLDRRFAPSIPIAPEPPPEFLGGPERVKLRRITIGGRLWDPQHIERTRVNGFGLVEDYDVGPSLEANVGYASELLGSSQNEGFMSGQLRTGFASPRVFGVFDASMSSRIQTILLDTVMRFDGRIVQQSRFGQTLVLAAQGIAGHNTSRDFQAVVGGLSGLRAYPVQAVAGTRLWRLNAENRWTVGENFWENLTIGGVAFTDAARAWGPGSGSSDWFVSAGLGVRLALPQWSLGQVLRMDVAWPLQPTREGRREAVLSFGSNQAF
jgi:hypothetical protein